MLTVQAGQASFLPASHTGPTQSSPPSLQVTEGTSVQDCGGVFAFLDSRTTAFKAPALAEARCRNTLLRTCNMLLKRLSKVCGAGGLRAAMEGQQLQGAASLRGRIGNSVEDTCRPLISVRQLHWHAAAPSTRLPRSANRCRCRAPTRCYAAVCCFSWPSFCR